MAVAASEMVRSTASDQPRMKVGAPHLSDRIAA
jgi:hypothetical protein